MVNEELWREAYTYGDVQLMPFVDYYSLITLKTIAICIYGVNALSSWRVKFCHFIEVYLFDVLFYFWQTNIVSAKYIMKTDDDAFVRIDEVLASLSGINITTGLLYGRINSDSEPHRNMESKWFISPEVKFLWTSGSNLQLK